MIFPNLHLEKVIQVSDKTRLDGTTTFVSKDEAAITMVEIEPEAAAGFIDVTGSLDPDVWFLDWEYAGISRTVTVTVRVTTDGAPVTSTQTIAVIIESEDKLFSNDQDLVTHEPDILRYIRDGRNSWKDIHRRAQDLILAYLDEAGYVDIDGDRLTKSAFVDIEEGRQWSTFICLRLIWQGLSNSVEDVQMKKALEYEKREVFARQRSVLRLDVDKDGILDDGEGVNLTSSGLVRV